MRHESPSSSESSSRRLKGKQALVTRSLHVSSFHKYQFPQMLVPRASLGPGERGGGGGGSLEGGRWREHDLHCCAFLGLTHCSLRLCRMVTDNKCMDSCQASLQLRMGESSPGEPSAPITQLEIGKGLQRETEPKARSPSPHLGHCGV